MKFVHSFALLFACLVAASLFFAPAPVEAKKKKLLTAILLGALLGSKQKLMPLPLPLPVCIHFANPTFQWPFHLTINRFLITFSLSTDPITDQTWKGDSISGTLPLSSLVSQTILFKHFYSAYFPLVFSMDHQGGYGGGGGGGGHYGGGGDYAAAASNFMPQFALPPRPY